MSFISWSASIAALLAVSVFLVAVITRINGDATLVTLVGTCGLGFAGVIAAVLSLRE